MIITIDILLEPRDADALNSHADMHGTPARLVLAESVSSIVLSALEEECSKALSESGQVEPGLLGIRRESALGEVIDLLELKRRKSRKRRQS